MGNSQSLLDSIGRVMCRVFLRLDAQTAGALWWPWIHCFEEVQSPQIRQPIA